MAQYRLVIEVVGQCRKTLVLGVINALEDLVRAADIKGIPDETAEDSHYDWHWKTDVVEGKVGTVPPPDKKAAKAVAEPRMDADKRGFREARIKRPKKRKERGTKSWPSKNG